MINLFARAVQNAGSLLHKVRNMVFRKKAEEERREKMQTGLILGIVGAVIIILIGWYAASKLWPKPAETNSVANPIAEARITVVGARACGKACWDPQLFTDALTSQGIKVIDKEIVYADGWWPFGRGKDIAKQYQIAKVPTVIVEFQGENQPDISKFFSPTLDHRMGFTLIIN